jgi:hypothetical protein
MWLDHLCILGKKNTAFMSHKKQYYRSQENGKNYYTFALNQVISFRCGA